MADDYDNYTYIEETGIIVPDTSTIKDRVETDFKTAFGEDIDLTAETLQGRLIEMMTQYRVNTLGINAENANQINIKYASGRFLDAIGALFGVQRIAATSTRVFATVAGVAGTIIPAGTRAQTTAGAYFYLENSTTIPDAGTINTYFLSEDKGEIACDIGTLTVIVDAVLGWETITNNVNAVIGTEQESDSLFRARIEASRYKGNSLMRAIKGKLANVENVVSSFAYDNPNDEELTYDTITLDPHSIVVIVDGGSDSDIAEALFESKTGGTGYTAISGQSVTVNITDTAYGTVNTVIFNRPDYQNFYVKVSVRKNVYAGSDLETDVKNAVLSWASGEVANVDGLKIGQSVSAYEIGAAVSDVIPSIYVKQVMIGKTAGTYDQTEIDYTVAQVGVITADAIEVEVLS